LKTKDNSFKTQLTGTLIFLIQIVLAIYAISEQFDVMEDKTDGISISMFVSVTLFFAINFWLSLKAKSNGGKLEALYVRISYGASSFGQIIIIGYCIYNRFVCGEEILYSEDLLSFALMMGAIILIITFSLNEKIPLSDPIIRGYLAVAIIGISQLMFAYTIYVHGNGGVSNVLIWSAYITIAIRLAQLGISIRSSFLDREKKGMLIAETGNVLSWSAVTLVYYFS
jgi:hypothetical protein